MTGGGAPGYLHHDRLKQGYPLFMDCRRPLHNSPHVRRGPPHTRSYGTIEEKNTGKEVLIRLPPTTSGLALQ